MAGFIRRFTEQPTVEVIREIEGVNIIDIAPPDPATGVGSGTVLLMGEFEDGFFATDEDSNGGAVEVFGSEDYRAKFGSFGYTYNGVVANNPSARRHQSELWNGNGFLKSFKLRATRLMISRVDTSVGSVSFDPLACIDGGGAGGQVFAVEVGDDLNVTTDTGSAGSTPLTGAAATVAGSGEAFATIISGDTFGIRVDGGIQINVVFAAADIDQATVIAKINSTIGFVVAAVATAEVDLTGIVLGTSGSIQLIEVVPGVLGKLGHAVGTTAGTGTFGNLDAVTGAELVDYVNGDAALTAIQVQAELLTDGTVRLCNDTPAAVSTILIPLLDPIGEAAFFAPLSTTISIADNGAGTINAGTRVRNAGGDEWVTMQTLDIPAAAEGPFSVKVRPAFDDGSATGDTAGMVTILVDQADFGSLTVTNPGPLNAAKNEVQMDNAYITALNTTLDAQSSASEANFLTIARRTDTIIREGRGNSIKATECGFFGRKLITGDPLGSSINDIIANVDNFRSDRVFYTGKGLKVRIPDIAERGLLGGLGFTVDGVITVRPDGPLTTICSIRAPEDNPGQQTNLVDDFFQVDAFGETLTIDAYKAFRREGVAVPKIETGGVGTVFQSGVTSSLESGRTTMARRKMADFLQDTLSGLLIPFVKRLNTQSRRNAILATTNSFLNILLSPNNPELQRIEAFSVDDSVNAGNTPAQRALGIYRLSVKVRTLASLDFIVATVEAGTNTIIVNTN